MVTTMMLGERIRKLRKNMGLTQKEMSKKLGITQANLCGYECGRNVPTIQNLVNIARVCNVSLDWLCGLVSEPTPISDPKDVKEVLAQLMDNTGNSLVIELKVVNQTEDRGA